MNPIIDTYISLEDKTVKGAVPSSARAIFDAIDQMRNIDGRPHIKMITVECVEDKLIDIPMRIAIYEVTIFYDVNNECYNFHVRLHYYYSDNCRNTDVTNVTITSGMHGIDYNKVIIDKQPFEGLTKEVTDK